MPSDDIQRNAPTSCICRTEVEFQEINATVRWRLVLLEAASVKTRIDARSAKVCNACRQHGCHERFKQLHANVADWHLRARPIDKKSPPRRAFPNHMGSTTQRDRFDAENGWPRPGPSPAARACQALALGDRPIFHRS